MSKKYFNNRYRDNAGSPENIKFVVYSDNAWKSCIAILEKSRKIVDLGVGGGTLISNVSKVTSGKILGVDQSENSLKIINSLFPFVETRCADVLDTGLPESSVDTVLSTMTIEHVDDIAMLKEVYRILEDDGYFFVTSVVKKSWAIYFYKNPEGEYALEPTHLREYKSLGHFTNLLKSGGFEIKFEALTIIKFPLFDPLFKLISKVFHMHEIINNPIIEKIRLLIRIPIPGYYAVEVLCKKK